MRALLLVLALVAPLAVAQEEAVRLDPAPIDPRDLASLQSGARTFVNYCLNCHSAGMMRYVKLEEIGLTEQQIKDTFGVTVFLIIFFLVVFFAPEMGGYFLEANNFIAADPLKTPPHIAPVWYFTPYYAMLRAVPSFLNSQFWGVLVMGIAVLIFFFLPWLDHSPVKSIRYRPGWHKAVLTVWVVAFFILGWLGTLEPDPVKTIMAQVCTVIYFAFFLLMPWWSQMGTFKPVPDRVTFHPH